MATRRARHARPRRTSPLSANPGSWGRFGILASVALIVIAGVVAYRGSFDGVFVLDDGPSIVHNPNIRALWPLSQSMSAPPEVTVAGRPVVSFTLALNYALAPADSRDVFEPVAHPADPAGAAATDPSASAKFYANVWGYHAVNLVIHLAAALALFGVVRRTIARRPIGVSATAFALTVALIWTVHPLATGSVIYVVQRAEALMGLCLLLTLYCAIRAAHDGTPAGAARAWSGAAIVVCAVGMGSKEVMVVAPVIVLIWDWVFLGRLRWSLYSALAATWTLLVWLMWTHPRPESVGFGFAAWPWWRYFFTQLVVITHYLRLAIVPVPLVLDYGWPPATGYDALPGLIVVTGLAALAVWGLWYRRTIGFLAAVFLLVLAPTSSVVPIVTEIAAEHRMYVPLAAVVCTGAVLGWRALAWIPPRARRPASIATVAAIAIVFIAMTDARNADYRSDEGIWQDTIAKRPQNPRARINYAADLLLGGDAAGAERELREAVALDSTMAQAHANLGVALCRLDRCEEGIRSLERAIALEPGNVQAHRDLAEAHASRGDALRAIAEYRAALEQQPDDVFLLNRAAWILATAIDDRVRVGEEALGYAERAVVLTVRRDEVSLDSLAAALAEVGKFDEAAQAGAEALAVAQARGNQAMLPELRVRLGEYQGHRVIRQRVGG